MSNPKEYKGKFKELFNNNNPIYLEIGMGKGQFIYQNAKKYKDINFIGIERFDSIMAKAILKMEKLDNLILIKYDANLISDLFDHEIDKIYLPDVTTTTKTFESVLDAIEERNYKITIPKIDEEIDYDDLHFKVLYTGTDEKNLKWKSS